MTPHEGVWKPRVVEAARCPSCDHELRVVENGAGQVIYRFCDTEDCPVLTFRADGSVRSGPAPMDPLEAFDLLEARYREQLAIAREELERQRDRNWNVGSGHALVRMDAIERGEPDPGPRPGIYPFRRTAR